MSAARGQRGFTLIELMIAIAVFVVMAAMAYGGLSSVISTREAVTAALERSKTLQMSVWRIRRDLEQIVNRPVRDGFGDTQPAIVGSPNVGLRVTRNGWRNPLGEARSTLQRVGYRINEDDALVREYWRVLDRAQDSAPVESTLLENVETIEWRYLDGDRQWRDNWPPGTENTGADGTPSAVASQRYDPPLAIELRLTTAAWGELRLLFMVPGAEK
ncbi:type II secretion system minor pseudopilin GspJ [Salinisphaera orenii]|uniref:Type II secretion system protein J n=1 Tax=Salinisphaera orenii YIM 95161 TaxID=1051139 RepID=A0A423PL79_9GAMM|nr:type II secretion system minor pseudopilin GspJ [Salinisphaera halophila]ROO26333.1 general secretion pathway protein J [Salinisphaera halophila YIM 95161]